jgi:flagellar biosynthetic protein FlhB
VNESSEKTFEATPRRIAKAKREGQIARSSEFAANCSFAAAGVTVVTTAPLLGAVACNVLSGLGSRAAPNAACALILAVALAPVAAASVAGTFANLVQSGGLIFVAITPKAERLNPIEGFRRILSRETLAHSLRATLAFTCATAAMAPIVAWSGVAMMRTATIAEVTTASWCAAQDVAIAAVSVGLFFSLAEYGAARRTWLRKLRMSFEERKREAKEEEGDAVARGRRRALHRALLRSGVARVKDAAFVVTNPEHVAVALEYRPPQVCVPRVLVRAVDDAARRVRELAAGYGIPILEDVALARALYSDGRTGEPIPHAHYVAVAEVVAALLRLKKSDGGLA